MSIRHHGPISGVAAHGDRWVATAGYDNQVILWSRHDQAGVARATHDHLANQCSFSPDGSFLVTASSDHTARLWSVPDLKLLAVFGPHDDDVEMVAVSPDQRHVATASRDYHVRVYRLNGTLQHTFSGHRADVISIEWAGNDEVVSSSDDGTVKRWSLLSATLVGDIDLGGIETDTLARAADGTLYVGNDLGQIVVLWGDGERATIDAHAAGIKRVIIDQARQLIVTLSYDRTVAVWNIGERANRPSGERPGTPYRTLTTTLPAVVWPRSCAVAGDDTLVFATFGSTYATFDLAKATWQVDAVAPTGGINAVLVDPTIASAQQQAGSGVLTVGDAGIVRRDGRPVASTGSLCNFLVAVDDLVVTGGQLGIVFDAASGAALHQHRSPLNCGAAWQGADGTWRVLIGAYTGEGLLFEKRAGRLVHIADVVLHDNAIKGLAVSGDLLLSVCADTAAAWHRLDDLSPVERRPAAHSRIANGCAGLGAGRFASVSRDRCLRLWPEGRVIQTPHTHSIKCVAASPCGRWVATGAYNGRVAIYDLAAASWALDTRPTTAGISSLCAAPLAGQPGRFLASSYHGSVYPLEVGSR